MQKIACDTNYYLFLSILYPKEPPNLTKPGLRI